MKNIFCVALLLLTSFGQLADVDWEPSPTGMVGVCQANEDGDCELKRVDVIAAVLPNPETPTRLWLMKVYLFEGWEVLPVLMPDGTLSTSVVVPVWTLQCSTDARWIDGTHVCGIVGNFPNPAWLRADICYREFDPEKERFGEPQVFETTGPVKIQCPGSCTDEPTTVNGETADLPPEG